MKIKSPLDSSTDQSAASDQEGVDVDMPDIVIDELQLPEFKDGNVFYTFNYGSPDATSNKIYPGALLCSIQAVAMLVSWFSSFPGMSKESFSALLNI